MQASGDKKMSRGGATLVLVLITAGFSGLIGFFFFFLMKFGDFASINTLQLQHIFLLCFLFSFS